MQEFFYLQNKFLKDFLSFINESYSLFVPEVREDNYCYSHFSQGKEPVFNAYRNIEPLKTLLIPAKERLDTLQPSKEKPIAVFGAKNCDLNALKVQDFIYLGQPPKFGCEGEDCPVCEDPVYAERRKKLLIISGDCTAFKDVCWCLGVGIKPYPDTGFDINLSFIDDGFVVELGSKKGQEALSEFEKRMVKATSSQLTKRKQKREKIISEMEETLVNLHPGPVEAFQQVVKKGYNSDKWKEFSVPCVECGGCNFICDTCHCFLLADEKYKQINARLKLWDSCLYANFAKVAGGANPLDTRSKRLRNRFMKKFDFFPDNLGKYACCGCGRCIEVCPAKIDIREVLKTLYNESITPKK